MAGPLTYGVEFEAALRRDVFDLDGGLDGDDCGRLFNEIDALRARLAERERERDRMTREAMAARKVDDEMGVNYIHDESATCMVCGGSWSGRSEHHHACELLSYRAIRAENEKAEGV